MVTKYSVFISSTFENLREERRAVQDTVIEAGDFPVQMESFPASDDAAFDLITTLLDQCDYCVLIIGGRYGAIADDGHKEYRYAVERQIPVLVMLHGQRGQIPSDKTERTDTGKRLLEEFIEEVSATKTRKTWASVAEPAGAHDVGDAERIGLVGLVALRRQRGAHVLRLQADRRQAKFS